MASRAQRETTKSKPMHPIVALEGGPQPGDVVHPLSPEGWLPGEVQAIPRIFLWSKNTRTHEDLEWFGPPERNTLRPLSSIALVFVDESILCLQDPFET